MTEKVTATYIMADDWAAFYINGEIMIEDHSINLKSAMKLLEGKTLTKFRYGWADSEWLESIYGSSFPEKESDLENEYTEFYGENE